MSGGWFSHAQAASAQGPAREEGGGLKAGVASVCITPERPMWMAGLGARNKRSEGKYQDLFLKALALQDNRGQRAVIVTSDLIAVTSNWRDPVLEQVKKRFALGPDEVLLNVSHTHCGPVLAKSIYPEWDPQYTAALGTKTVDAIELALGDLQDARLSVGRGSCSLSVNRRRPLPEDPKRVDPALLPNPQGLTDHDVPVLKVARADGSIKAVMFLYACHPTTMGGYLFGGDFAGFAQQFVEQEIPQATALFLQGCGGDIKPRNVGINGRFKSGPVEIVAGFGRDLGQAVVTTLIGEMCVEYALRLKRELGRHIWVAGYSNDVAVYIPSARMIPEGGYEVERPLLATELATPFEPTLEDTIVAKVHEMLDKK